MPNRARGPTGQLALRVRRFAVQGWWKHRWRILVGLWLLVLVLGYIGFSLYAGVTQLAHSPLETLRLFLQFFALRSGVGHLEPQPWLLRVVGLIAPVVAYLTLIRTLGAIFSEQYQAVRLVTTRNHVIIAGLGTKGSSLARKFLAEGIRVVGIERNRDNPNIRACLDDGVLVLIGDASTPALLRRAGIQRARALIADVATEPGDDIDNARIAVQARMLAQQNRRRPLTVVVHLDDPNLTALLAAQAEWAGVDSAFRLEFFNAYSAGSRALLAEFSPRGATAAMPLGPDPHLVIVGLDQLGCSVLLSAARLWRRNRAEGHARFRITLVGRDAQHKIADLCQQHPGLSDICDCIPHSMDVTGADFRRAAFLFGPDGRFLPSVIYICLRDETLGLLAGLGLWERTCGSGTPIIICASNTQGVAALLHARRDDPAAGELHVFSLLDRAYQPEQLLGGTLDALARAIHEEYVSQQTALGHTMEDNRSQAPWDELPLVLQESNREQARHIRTKLASFGYALGPLYDWDAETYAFPEPEVEQMAQMEHARFVAERQRAIGSRRAVSKELRQKLVHTLVPWADLVEEEREKDRQAVRNIPTLLARAGLQVIPIRKGHADEAPDPR